MSPCSREHIKPRLLGHWGTSPGLSLIYAHVNRLIRRDRLEAIYLAGPGHGGPAVVACTYLEGTYSEVYPRVTRDLSGLRRLFRQFSTPGGIPSHVSAPTPGSIHEGGELGYVLTHAFGAVFDDPSLLAVAVVGDGEAETGPLEGSWKGISFLNPARDGAVLPILHLNGYKIAGPTVLGRSTDAQVRSLLEGHGYEVLFVEGDVPAQVHQALAAALEGMSAAHPGHPDGGPQRSGVRAGPAGRCWSCAPPRDGPGRRRWTACRWRGPSAAIKFPWPACATTPSTSGCWRPG